MRSRGYTLVELTASLVIGLLLVLGVNTVFRISSDSVGAAEAFATVTRANRSAQTVFHQDLGNAVTHNAPFLIIRSEAVAAFLDRRDELGDRDYSRSMTLRDAERAIRTRDLNGNGREGETSVPGETIPQVALSDRTHRIDQLSFFGQGVFRRQTGNDGVYVADMWADEAMIWYGHLKQPGPDGTLVNARDPGVRDGDEVQSSLNNPNNFYARQWVLGRMALLLIEPAGGSEGPIHDRHGVAQLYIQRRKNARRDSTTPLALESQAQDPSATDIPVGGSRQYHIQWGRYDLAGTSVAGFQQILTEAISAGNTNWYQGSGGLSYRFSGYPYPARPLSSAAVARTVPVFLVGCTQFCVEFAGDFLTQDDAGNVVPVTAGPGGFAVPAPDGIMDFFLTPGPGGTTYRHIRWYGFPRDTNGDGRIEGNRADNNAMPDVVPLRDVARVPFPFERNLDHADFGIPARTDYMRDGVRRESRYLCAWGPDTEARNVPLPKMVRVTLKLDDPRGRMMAGQSYEYVVTLP